MGLVNRLGEKEAVANFAELIVDDVGQLEHEDGEDTEEEKSSRPGDTFEFLVLELERAERLSRDINCLCFHPFFLRVTCRLCSLHGQPRISRTLIIKPAIRYRTVMNNAG